MARLRKPEQPDFAEGAIPAALQDPMNSPVWRRKNLYDKWCIEHLGRTIKLHTEGTYWRISFATDEWCRQNGLMSEKFPQQIDYQRAKAAGIERVGSLRRSQLNAEDRRDDS